MNSFGNPVPKPSFWKTAALYLVVSCVVGFITEGLITPIGEWGAIPRPPQEIPIYWLGMFCAGFLLGSILPRIAWLHPIGLFMGETLASRLLLYVSWPFPHHVFLFLIYLPIPASGVALGWFIRSLFGRLRKPYASNLV
jgi:hypothetical protein